ncbi:ABC transporter substrate-binding protein [Rhizobium ruizarguesonis]|uniref:ABC transporter substrate-binding protein n=1 Tax=Rhizobium ruizarguesonis TaxID=2081791 RepID=UPI001446BAFD|nr:ABC transporter substrate-binding protein [Rhizobium ruizarguesonis]NKQ87482.1 peptide ABC transporter substrate-binding protein [Rhizobium ruizarguesonis]
MKLFNRISALSLVLAATAAEAQPVVVADFWSIRNNWAMTSDDVYVGTVAGCYEGLARVNYDGKLEPWLATSFTHIEPNIWEVTLRQDVVFQDGTPFDADAVAFALTSLLHGEVSARAFPPKLFKSVDAIGKDKVRITTAQPLAMLPAYLAAPATSILSKAAYKPGGAIDPINHCTGPYTIVSVDQAQGLKVKATPTYWGKKPAVDEGEVRFVLDANTRAVQARSGEADISRLIPATSVKQVNDSGVAKISEAATPRTTMLVINNKKKPFDDVRVRKAIQAAIDNQAISEALFEGLMPPANDVFRPTDAWAPKDQKPTFNPDVAKSLLAEAGIAPGSLKVEIIAYVERAEFKDIAAAVQQMLADVGIQSTIKAAQYNAIEPDLLSGNFDLAFLSRNYLTDVLDPAGFLSSDFSCEGGFNLAHYCSPEVDALIKEARANDNDEQRYALYAKIAQKLQGDAAVVDIVHVNTFDAIGDRIQGFRPHPLNNYYLTPELSAK